MKAANEQLEWPDGATHYIGGGFHKYEDTSSSGECWVNNEWVTHLPSIDYYNGTSWTVHHKPAATPYQPEVGEWFIKQNGDKARLIGLMSFGHYVCESIDSCVDVVTSLQGAKPIKTEREQFIEQAAEYAKGYGSLYVDKYVGELYDNGARFK